MSSVAAAATGARHAYPVTVSEVVVLTANVYVDFADIGDLKKKKQLSDPATPDVSQKKKSKKSKKSKEAVDAPAASDEKHAKKSKKAAEPAQAEWMPATTAGLLDTYVGFQPAMNIHVYRICVFHPLEVSLAVSGGLSF